MTNQIITYTSNTLYSIYSYTLQLSFNTINYIDDTILSIPTHISNYFYTCPIRPQKEESIIQHFQNMNTATCDINNSPDLICPAPEEGFTLPSITFGDVIIALIGAAAESSKCLSAEFDSMEYHLYCD